MFNPRLTMADLLAGASEEACRGCPPDRVCAWACRQGWGVTDTAVAAQLGVPLDRADDAHVEVVRQILCDCYS